MSDILPEIIVTEKVMPLSDVPFTLFLPAETNVRPTLDIFKCNCFFAPVFGKPPRSYTDWGGTSYLSTLSITETLPGGYLLC